ncbi:unnamed protein product [Phytomonas sp. EM1]|nr:unnamed protein product [Phytomonas sp. EM1]|eukprot:CCW61506.1 unnamed protein product [Phytomonas sp. isolate EM1]
MTTATSASLDALEKELEVLERVKVFDENIKGGSERILQALPSLEEEKHTDTKVRILLLRSRARLLLPCVSKEAERDIQTALKLKQCSINTWLVLSECYLRRNAFKEACDALDNALLMDSSNAEALCRYSQVQRNRCSEKGVTEAQRLVFLSDAVAKSHKAVQANIDNPDAWNSLSLSLLSKAVAGRVSYDAIRKALSAIQQAIKRAQDDPDLHYNKGVLECLSGHFGTAAAEALRANELDGHRLKDAKRLCEQNVDILRKAISCGKILKTMRKRDLKKFLASISATVKRRASHKATTESSWMDVAVVEVLSDSTMQPLAILAVNEGSDLFTILLYELSSSCVKIGDIVSFPATSQHMAISHEVPAIPFLQLDGFSTSMVHYYPFLEATLINEKPIPIKNRVPVQMCSRLFA